VHSSWYGAMQATDPRDRIFALLGLADDRDYLGIIPDYTKSTETVFVESAQAFLTKGLLETRLNLLSYCGIFEGDSPSTALPSWAPNWCRPGLESFSPLCDQSKAGRYKFQDSSQENAVFKARTGGWPILVLRGYQEGKVLTLGDVFPDNKVSEENHMPAVISWLKRLLVLSHTGSEDLASEIARQEAVASTAIADWEFDASEVGGMRRAGRQSAIEYMRLTGSLKAEGTTPEAKTAWLIENTRNYRLSLAHSSGKRRPFVSSKGRIGLGPESLRKDDYICEFDGSDVPFALRKENIGFRIVGELYVYGMMDGEHRRKYAAANSWPKKEAFEII
jgi:hypothetical protein